MTATVFTSTTRAQWPGWWCRVLSSLKHNLTYYLSIAAAGVVGIGLLLISGRLRASDLLPLAMLLSNTYGVLLVT